MIQTTTIEKILDRADLIDLVREYVPSIKIRGSKGICCCPFHNERNPSFSIDNNKGLYWCFTCKKGGNAIQFVQEKEGCDFVEAARLLAKKYNVKIEEADEPETAEQREHRLKVDAMRSINEKVCQFYVDKLWSDEGKAALKYISKIRDFSDEFIKKYRIGFASKGASLYNFAKGACLNLDLMAEMNLIRKTDRGDFIDVNQERMVIPIRSRSNQVIGFTSRQLPGNEFGGKYINSPNTDCYNKSQSVFGIEAATRLAVQKGVIYLVEGAPDVMRLQSLGIDNTVASLGGSWTDDQLNQLKRYRVKLCFIPDADPPKPGERFGAGVRFVMENAKKALDLGFTVTVKEIIPTDDSKSDPDSYITSSAILSAIEEKDFIPWYFKKISIYATTVEAQDQVLHEVAALLAKLESKATVQTFVDILSKDMMTRKQWNDAITDARNDQKEKRIAKRNRNIDREALTKYGFYEDHNCYYSIKDGEYQWSNFSMTPLFHIKDSLNPKRLYKIKNASGTELIIELKQSDLTSLAKFSERVEGMGNFIWLAKQEQLNRLKMYLYEQTETAVEITQLGWQQQGFWAFGNGVFIDGEWIAADDYGIVRLEGIGNFYLPATSKIYRGETKLFQFERKFIHTTLNRCTLRQYTDKMIEVFGDNAKVGICYLLATLFRDVVKAVTKNFPILNLFGQKGSGKSEMGHSLMAFFIAENAPQNLQNATDAALAETVAQCANALVHLDEYKNTIDLSRREFIKGLYDGTGRTRMNMDRDKKRETTAVDCGVVMSGQEMPTIDNAIFSRLIYLTFNTSVFTNDAKKRFDELKELRKLGCSHLTLEILAHRKKFEVEFPGNYRMALDDVVNALANDSVEDRTLRSWVILLAAFRTLSGVLDIGFDYKELLSICINGIMRQNNETRSNNEISQFWNAVDVMHQQGLAVTDTDFRIIYADKLNCRFKGKPVNHEWHEGKKILLMNFRLLLASYRKFARGQGDLIVPESTLKNYLEVSQEFLGIKNACRFYMVNNIHEGTMEVDNTFSGGSTRKKTSTPAQAYCFDYNLLEERYGINLEVSISDDQAPYGGDTSDNSNPF